MSTVDNRMLQQIDLFLMLDETTAAVHKEAVQVACMAFRVGVEGDRSTDDHRRRKGLGEIKTED